jgi:hypothetical protein
MPYAVSPIDHRSDVSFPFSREISKPFGGLDCILEWCRFELRDDWRWQLIDVSSLSAPGRYIFYFDSERDAVAFALMWL